MTLVELLVSVVLLTIGCLAALSLQATAMTQGNKAHQVTIAAFLAESHAEKLRTMAFNAVDQAENKVPTNVTRAGEACSGPNAPSPLPADCSAEKKCFLRTTAINKGPTPSSLVATVTVEWPADTKKQKLTYDTIITTLDLENSSD
jgi:type IV pilus modification protein PilV